MVTKTRILIVDDDSKIVQDIKVHLESLGYETATATDGESGLKLAQTTNPDLVVLDITFPVSTHSRGRVIDGVEMLRILRETSSIPILMLSSTNISSVKVMALNIGADDYISKPFELRELSARIEAILRRTGIKLTEEKVIQFHRLMLDPGERRVWKDNNLIELTGIEFKILYMLARRPFHAFSRDNIIEHVWKDDSICVSKAVDVHINNIRKKIEDNPSCPTFIIAVRGIGYRFEDDPS